MDCLGAMEDRGLTSVESRADAQAAYNRHVQRNTERTVWTTGGCGSWYLDAEGRTWSLWPKPTFRFRRELAKFDPDEYVLLSSAAERVAAPA